MLNQLFVTLPLQTASSYNMLDNMFSQNADWFCWEMMKRLSCFEGHPDVLSSESGSSLTDVVALKSGERMQMRESRAIVETAFDDTSADSFSSQTFLLSSNQQQQQQQLD